MGAERRASYRHAENLAREEHRARPCFSNSNNEREEEQRERRFTEYNNSQDDQARNQALSQAW